MADMPLEFGGQGRTYLLKLSCIPAGLLTFFCIEYVLLILPRLLKVGVLLSIGAESSWHQYLMILFSGTLVEETTE